MVLSAADVSKELSSLTAKANSAQAPANSITITNIGLATLGQGPIPLVIAQLQDEVNASNTIIQQLSGAKPFTAKTDQDEISGTFKTFATVHQSLLSILIGKGSLQPDFVAIVGPPVAGVLRQLEACIDTLTFELIDLYGGDKKELEKQKQALDGLLTAAIRKWSGN